jgi:hypothetical protein
MPSKTWIPSPYPFPFLSLLSFSHLWSSPFLPTNTTALSLQRRTYLSESDTHLTWKIGLKQSNLLRNDQIEKILNNAEISQPEKKWLEDQTKQDFGCMKPQLIIKKTKSKAWSKYGERRNIIINKISSLVQFFNIYSVCTECRGPCKNWYKAWNSHSLQKLQ